MGAHTLAHTPLTQVDPTGSISRICLRIDHSVCFWPLPAYQEPYDEWRAAGPTALYKMLLRLDRACVRVDNTLHGVQVVVALSTPNIPDVVFEESQKKELRKWRDQMPALSRQKRTVFRERRHGLTLEEYYQRSLDNIFEHDGRYWKDIALD